MTDRELMAQVCACVDAYRAEQAGDCDIELGPEYALEQVRLLVAENSSRAGCASGADGSAVSQTGTPSHQRTGETSVKRDAGSVVDSTTYSPGDSPETEE